MSNQCFELLESKKQGSNSHARLTIASTHDYGLGIKFTKFLIKLKEINFPKYVDTTNLRIETIWKTKYLFHFVWQLFDTTTYLKGREIKSDDIENGMTVTKNVKKRPSYLFGDQTAQNSRFRRVDLQD